MTVRKKKTTRLSMDTLDFAIVSCLQQDGRMSFTVMAEKLKVSIGNIRTRVNKLIEEGTINIIGRVNPEKVDFNHTLKSQYMYVPFL